MRRMADHAAVAQRFMLENKRASLRGVALEAGLIFAQERHAAALERLLHAGSTAFDRPPRMRVVAINATHFAFQHRMMVRQFKFRANFKMALETRFRRFSRIHDRVRRTAALHVKTSRPVA